MYMPIAKIFEIMSGIEFVSKCIVEGSLLVRTRDIDTPDDYERMVEWFKKGCKE